jgi:hypothetical protein
MVSEELRQQADRFRISGLLGKPGALSRLFDFLVERSLTGEVPKELEIAVTVFGKSPGFDVAQDSVVRVYVHKLRRRLEEFHARTPQPPGCRISIPKGEYRVVLERAKAPLIELIAPEPPVPVPESPVPAARPWVRHAPVVVLVLLALCVGALGGARWFGDRDTREERAVRNSSIWAPLLADDLPISIVVGDYYLLGEVDESGRVRRLVREFFVNSHEDFLDHVELNPELMQRYRNLGLTYLPSATAAALQNVVPVLGSRKPVHVMLMSQLTAEAIRSSHVIYVGYISGLGMLGDHVFAGSRVSPGGSFDELIDARTNRTYLSTAMPPTGSGGNAEFRDYAYFSTFDGPGGNRIVVLAGTRDTGVVQAAESVTRSSGIDELTRAAGASESFEALYEVYGMSDTRLKSTLVFASALKPEGIWDIR